MKTFAYRGYTVSGARTAGLVEALNPKEAREKLAARGILPEALEPAGQRMRSRRRRVSLSDRSAFYREYAALLRAGVPAVAALELMAAGRSVAGLDETLSALRDRLRGGESLSTAWPEVAGGIDRFEEALLESGQRAGRLPDALLQAAEYLEEETRIRGELASALLYPLMVATVALVAALTMLLAVLPRLNALFADAGIAFPPSTRALLWLGREGRWVIVTVILLFLFAGVLIARLWRDPAQAPTLERLALRAPVVRSAFRQFATARFCRTLSLLIRGGVPLVDALPLAGRASGSALVTRALEAGSAAVRRGQSIAAALLACPILGETVTPWYRAGEAAGDLPGLLEQAARRYQLQWERFIQRLGRLLEPLLIVLVGGFVLLVALGLLQPLLSLNQIRF